MGNIGACGVVTKPSIQRATPGTVVKLQLVSKCKRTGAAGAAPFVINRLRTRDRIKASTLSMRTDFNKVRRTSKHGTKQTNNTPTTHQTTH